MIIRDIGCFGRSALALAAIILGSVEVAAQTAQEIVDKAYQRYAEMKALTVTINERRSSLTLIPQEAGGTPRFNIRENNLTRLEVKWKAPGDWWVTKGESREYENSSKNVFHSGLVKVGDSTPVSLYTTGGKNPLAFSKSPQSPGVSFESRLRSMLSLYDGADYVVSPILTKAAAGEAPWGLSALEQKGEETVRGVKCYRIDGRERRGGMVVLWVRADTFELSRLLFADRRGTLDIRGALDSRDRTLASILTTREIVYTGQNTSPALGSGDFLVPANAKPLPSSGPEFPFGNLVEVVKLATDLLPEKADARQEQAVAQPEQPASPAETQLLTQEQMAAIVLIEGENGAGTGFMTKIKDVDFIVTNLHVLCGNKKISIKNLRGEDVPVSGVFGAVGADIAILRIGKGEGDLRLAADVFGSSKIGDRVVVVGNRRGGGVATQTSGTIKGIGPNLVEVDASFQAGNSGSPIVNLGTNEVVGVATYSETRRVEIDAPTTTASGRPTPKQVEKRWFGFRIDSVSKWEPIDLNKFAEQEAQIAKFRELSEALVALLRIDFNTARAHQRLSGVIAGFETRVRPSANNPIVAANEVRDLFRVVRTLADDGVRDLTSGNYYDYFRTAQYWENSISAQLEYRKRISEALQRYERDSAAFLSRLRGGG